ncbi:hypothetical protein niasHS_006255 [Heterodera schachtii]|uniref:Fido domain-containing protein n=1 Tax=Heterodera schachtii TaxID=97005 RepID=A0ABD2JSX5_HETSC
MNVQEQQQRDRVERDRVAIIMREAIRLQQHPSSPFEDDAHKYPHPDHVLHVGTVDYYGRPLFTGVYRGQLRPVEREVRVGQHHAVPNRMVRRRMEQFTEWMNLADPRSRRGSALGVQRFAAESFFYFVKIHGFADANGRTGRLLLMLILRRCGYPTFTLSEELRMRFNRELDASTENQLLRKSLNFIKSHCFQGGLFSLECIEGNLGRSNGRRRMEQHIEWMNLADPLSRKGSALSVQSQLCFFFVWAHPWSNGNGRSARVVMSSVLVRAGLNTLVLQPQERQNYDNFLQLEIWAISEHLLIFSCFNISHWKNGRHSEAQQKPFTEEGTITELTDGRTINAEKN